MHAGGSARVTDIQELLAAYEHEGLIPILITGSQTSGSTGHGGYGLGVEVGILNTFLGKVLTWRLPSASLHRWQTDVLLESARSSQDILFL